MMQHLATQSSQIAALPGGQVNSQGKAPADAANGVSSGTWSKPKTSQKDDFSQVLDQHSRQLSKEDAPDKTLNGRPEDVAGNQSGSDKQLKGAASEPRQSDEKTTSDDSARASDEEQASASGNKNGENTNSQADENAENTSQDEKHSSVSATDQKLSLEQNPDVEPDQSSASDDAAVGDESTTVTADKSGQSDGINWLYSQADGAQKGGEQTDYLAFIDSIRALQERLTSEETPVTAQLLNSNGKEIDLSGWKKGSGELLPGDVLNKLQDWLATVLPEGMQVSGDGSAVEQIANAETLLSDVLNLVQQLNNTGSKTEQNGTPVQDDTLLNVLAAELLSGLRANQSSSDADNVKSAKADVTELNIGDAQVDLSTVANIQLAEDAIIVAESADSSLQNQASLLVSLMRQMQAGNSQVKTETTPALNKQGENAAAESLEAMLGQASDTTISELAQVMSDSASKANPLLNDTQLGQIRSQLVTGMEEIRSQLKQGHEPGINLAALVTQAIQDVAPDMLQGQNALTPVMQEVQQLVQLASLANLGSAQERQIAELVAVSRDVVSQDVRQHVGDTMKSMQQQATMDKPVPIHQPQGQQQIAEKIRWMVNGRQTIAEIRLDPPELGSMQVRLNVSGDSAAVSFVVQSQHAKEALADAMPRLRDMFAEQGINLGESFVSQQQSGQQGDGELAQRHGQGPGDEEFDESNAKQSEVVRPVNGLIDDYV
ncbi:flagellar hook-length control protein FliK [Alteromonas gilva]|uniref:Flagellar hook-length control protein FliK n=1 Tax=Alteromonas gilva TaxID=2987522 RepID=A0ABT5L0D9_9ALTE|nr:flagellar hook-length control protein FliK [Alteromonas gilva]MDC8830495.1 flagellar hook-length control protein FliK [Alteromonas gilva]